MEAYATTDGKLHHDPLDAQAHQYGLDLKPEVEAHLGSEYRYSITGYSRYNTIIEWEVARKLAQLKGSQ
jgi:hypothetical protein